MKDKNQIAQTIVVVVIVAFTFCGVISFVIKDYHGAAIIFGIVAALNCLGFLLTEVNKHIPNKKLY